MEHMKKGRQDCPTEKGAWKQNDNATFLPLIHIFSAFPNFYLDVCVCVLSLNAEWLWMTYGTLRDLSDTEEKPLS